MLELEESKRAYKVTCNQQIDTIEYIQKLVEYFNNHELPVLNYPTLLFDLPRNKYIKKWVVNGKRKEKTDV